MRLVRSSMVLGQKLAGGRECRFSYLCCHSMLYRMP
jgi:hypothetical protein